MDHLENQITVITVCTLAAHIHGHALTHTHTHTHCNTIPDTDAILHNIYNYYSYSAKLMGLLLLIITPETDAQSLLL